MDQSGYYPNIQETNRGEGERRRKKEGFTLFLSSNYRSWRELNAENHSLCVSRFLPSNLEGSN
jgi:hypothetical protein